LLLLGSLAWVGCSALQPGAERRGSAPPNRPGSPFLARQYLERGRRAWAAGNEANARFLIGRAVELDPGSDAALAFWEARWPLDSLPAPADSARRALLAGPAGRVIGEAAPVDPEPVAEVTSPDSGGGPATGAAGAREGGADRGERAAGVEPVPSGAAEPIPAGVAEAPPPGASPAEVAQIRARFESARGAGDRAAVERAGEELLRAQPHHLPTLHRVLSVWVDSGLDPAATESRVRDVLGSLEFGDPAYLAGKPDGVTDARYLRSFRGRFLDLLGWSAFQRGDLAQAEAALRSAETEINLRGRGDVTHLRHLAAFYERRRNHSKAEAYAIAAAARDETGSGEIRALAARLWTRTHGGTSGLEARLAREAERVRREERSAAIAGRLYAPLPIFSARRGEGGVVTDQALRGKVTVLVLWEPACADCLRLLRELAAGALVGGAGEAAAPVGRRSRQAAPGAGKVETIALTLGGDSAAARAALGGLPGIVTAVPENPRALALALDADRLPVTLVVEPAGFIQYQHVGYPDETVARERWMERLRWQIASLSSLRGTGTPSRR
jgi:hypothetical protein